MRAWEAIGWLGNASYFARFLIQWWFSEKARRSVAPSVFWWLSLGGVLLLGGYTLRESRAVLLAGFCVNGAIYVRNLWLHYGHGKGSRLGPIPAAGVGLGLLALLFATGAARPREALSENLLVLAIGVGGQVFWSTRFILQWWYSERAGRSFFPAAFWWFTLVGAALNLCYTGFLGDPVLIASFVPTPLYAIRNLMLERSRARRLLGRARDRARRSAPAPPRQ